MQGYQLTFFTQQSRTHGLFSIAEWLMKESRKLGINGVTVSTAYGGYGRDGKFHSARFFETAEQPVEVTMAVSVEDSARLFERIAEEQLKIFYVKTPVEFGVTGDE